jgi:hypothetical protein
MRLAREIALPLVADADPNVTAPASTDIFEMTGQLGDQLGIERGVEGHRMCLRFLTAANVAVPGATADFRCWALDDGATAALGRQAWLGLTAEAAAPHAQAFEAPLKGKLFFQVTATAAVGAATKLQIWTEEASSVAG